LKLAGFGFRAADPGPSPRPETPWHSTQFCSNTALPAVGFAAVPSAANDRRVVIESKQMMAAKGTRMV
jgi:hypothetical protein